MKSIHKIYLTWRKGRGCRRHIVGIIKKNSTKGICFEYIKENIPSAKKDGFVSYVDFPEIDKVYEENVLDIFGQRLIQADRSDIQKYYDFWELDKKYVADKFYMLAYTQGLLSTDNFEFLADFYPKKDLCFVSEICGLTHLNLPSDTLIPFDELKWIKEPNNEYDSYAVKVFKDKVFIGYIKKIHNKVFYKSIKGQLRITVKSINQKGVINRILVRISF